MRLPQPAKEQRREHSQRKHQRRRLRHTGTIREQIHAPHPCLGLNSQRLITDRWREERQRQLGRCDLPRSARSDLSQVKGQGELPGAIPGCEIQQYLFVLDRLLGIDLNGRYRHVGRLFGQRVREKQSHISPGFCS